MKVYVTGSTLDLKTLQTYIEALVASGATVTYDWTRDAAGDPDYRPADVTANLRGVQDAECVWLLVPTVDSAEAAFEVGYALGLGRTVILSGEDAGRSPFARLATEVFPEHDDAFAWLVDGGKTADGDRVPDPPPVEQPAPEPPPGQLPPPPAAPDPDHSPRPVPMAQDQRPAQSLPRPSSQQTWRDVRLPRGPRGG